jgi:hypothetical protein
MYFRPPEEGTRIFHNVHAADVPPLLEALEENWANMGITEVDFLREMNALRAIAGMEPLPGTENLEVHNTVIHGRRRRIRRLISNIIPRPRFFGILNRSARRTTVTTLLA